MEKSSTFETVAEIVTHRASRSNDNRVRILHGGAPTWRTLYHILRCDSILVDDGEFVIAGRLISTTVPVVGGIFSGVLKNTDIRFRWKTPSGQVYFEDTTATVYKRTKSIHTSTTSLPTNVELGDWTVEILIGGTEDDGDFASHHRPGSGNQA